MWDIQWHTLNWVPYMHNRFNRYRYFFKNHAKTNLHQGLSWLLERARLPYNCGSPISEVHTATALRKHEETTEKNRRWFGQTISWWETNGYKKMLLPSQVAIILMPAWVQQFPLSGLETAFRTVVLRWSGPWRWSPGRVNVEGVDFLFGCSERVFLCFHHVPFHLGSFPMVFDGFGMFWDVFFPQLAHAFLRGSLMVFECVWWCVSVDCSGSASCSCCLLGKHQ